MMAAVGGAVLRIIGKAPSATGIVQAADMPAAITAIESAIAHAEADPEPSAAASIDAGSDEVSLRQHAWPVLEMMRAAHASGDAITWGV